MKKLRVGVIGCGVMGSFHIKQYLNIPSIELLGASDVDPSRSIKEIPFFSDYRQLLELVDAVSIVTPTFTHYEIADKALDENVHVMIEKPITLDTEQGRKLIDKAKRKKLTLSVGHIERFNPAYMKLEKEVKGWQPIIIDIKRFSLFPERISDVSCVIDMMIHDIDLALKLAGSEVTKVSATGEIVRTMRLDKAHAVLTFKNGTVANIETSRINESKVRSIIVAGGKGVYNADLLARKLTFQTAKGSEQISVEGHDQLNYELKCFVRAVEKREKPVVTGEDGLAALDIAEKIEKAALSK